MAAVVLVDDATAPQSEDHSVFRHSKIKQDLSSKVVVQIKESDDLVAARPVTSDPSGFLRSNN